MFQHTAARRRLNAFSRSDFSKSKFQHTAARRRLSYTTMLTSQRIRVSTHSRPKAADFAAAE